MGKGLAKVTLGVILILSALLVPVLFKDVMENPMFRIEYFGIIIVSFLFGLPYIAKNIRKVLR